MENFIQMCWVKILSQWNQQIDSTLNWRLIWFHVLWKRRSLVPSIVWAKIEKTINVAGSSPPSSPSSYMVRSRTGSQSNWQWRKPVPNPRRPSLPFAAYATTGKLLSRGPKPSNRLILLPPFSILRCKFDFNVIAKGRILCFLFFSLSTIEPNKFVKLMGFIYIL